MNVERIFADADLSRGLAAAALPTDTSEFDAINEKLNTLTTAKTAKLDALMPQAVANPFAPEIEDATIVGMEDADTAILADGTKIRVSDPLRRYDAAEVKHEYDGVLPEMIANVLPSWVPGTGTNHKSNYSSDKQREQAALVLGKGIGDVTTQDVYDVGNMQQVQALADLTRGKDQERFVADVNPGGEYVNLNDPNSPLNIPVKINKNRTKDMHGRDLTPLYNAETGENVTAMHAADPRLNAFAPGVPEPAQFSVGNIAKGAASGAIQIAGGLADTVTSAGAVAVDAVTAAIGKPEWYTDQDRAIATGFFDKYKDAKWANSVTGYDPKYNEQQLGKALDSMKNGNYIQGIGQALTAGPGTLMDSTAYMALLTTGVGTVGMIASEVNDSIEEFGKNNKGAEPSAAQLARIVALDSVKVLLEKLPFVEAIKGKAATLEAIKSLSGALPEGTKRAVMAAAMSRAGTVAVNMVEEGAQEGAQGVIDYYNREYGTAADKGMNTDEIYKSMLGGAGAGGATGLVGQGVDAISGAKSLLPSKKEKAAETAAAVPTMTDEVPDHERKHMFDTLEAFDDDNYDFTNNTKDVLDNFYRAEDTFNRLAAASKNPAAVKEFGAQVERVRNRILSTVDNIDDNAPFLLKNDGEFKLGSAEDMIGGTGNAEAAEELIEFVLESSPSLSKQREAKLLKVAADNGVELAKFNELKGYYEVEAEAVEGKRGYRGYERALKALSATDTPNVRALDKAVKNAQGFLQSQENAVRDFEAGIREAENRANQANSPQNITKTTPERVKVVTPQKVKNFEFTINYTGELGNLTVHPSAYKVLKAKQRNVAGITNALATVSKYVKNKGLDVDTGTSVGIAVPLAGKNNDGSTKAGVAEYRKNDQAFYDRVGATKVILDTAVAKQEDKVSKKTSAYNKWDRDYRALNMSKINTGTYTKDDVVVINAKTVIKDGRREFADTKVKEQVEAAMKAGATIVIDNDIIRKRPDDYKNIALLLGKFSSKNNKYARIRTTEGGIVGSYMFKPAAIATKMNEEILAKAKVTKETKVAQTKAKGALILALAAQDLNGSTEETKAALAAAVAGAMPYFKATVATDTKDGSTAEENLMKFARRALDEEIEAGARVVMAEAKEHIKTRIDAGQIGTDADERLKAIIEFTEFWEDDINAKSNNHIELPVAINGVKKITNENIIKLANKKAAEYLKQSANTATVFKTWKQKITDIKAGKLGKGVKASDAIKDIDNWLTSVGHAARGNVKLEDTLSADMDLIYGQTEGKTADGKINTNRSYSTNKSRHNNATAGTTYEMDLNKIMIVNKTTALNSIAIDDILDALPELNDEVDTAIKAIEKAIDLAKFRDNKHKEGEEKKDKLTPQQFALVDAPGIALLLDKEGNINKAVVTGLVLSLNSAYKNLGYALSSKSKSMDDLERMMGGNKVSYKAARALSEQGMFTKSLATELRKDFMEKMGIGKNPDAIEAKRFDQAGTDLAQVAIAIGVETGVLKYSHMSLAEFKENVLGEDGNTNPDDKNIQVSFTRLTSNDVLADTKKVVAYDTLIGDMPVEDAYRTDPEFDVPSEAAIAGRLEKVKNEKLGTKIYNKAKELMHKAMNTEYVADVERIKSIFQNKETENAIKAWMGWIEISTEDKPNPEYDKLSMNKKDIQEAINRDVEKEIDELKKLTERAINGKTGRVSMWFMIDFLKNGRFGYDSNTVNPQTQKQLVRWLIQPADHIREVTYTLEGGKHKFTRTDKGKSKDITKEMMFAIGQAFGYGVDKKSMRSTKIHVQALLTTLMSKDNTQLDSLFTEMLESKGKKVKVGELEVEIEHIAHAHQAIEFLKALKDPKNKGKVTTSLTAEIDAKTSGFGIKTALMPIIDKVKSALKAVGIDIGSNEDAAKAVTEHLDPDPKLNKTKILDMYQSLGKSMKPIVWKDLDGEMRSVVDAHTVNSLSGFDKVQNVLSIKETADEITGEIRNLFKQPFMEFNYSAGLATIRKSLAISMAHKAAEQGMESDAKFKELGLDKITGLAFPAYVEAMKTTRLNKITTVTTRGNKGEKYNLESRLAAAMDLVYGVQVEAAFVKQFEPAIRAQKVINQAYQVMFKQYKIVYDMKLEALRKSKTDNKNFGVVSAAEYKALLKELHGMFPSIRSPLASMDDVEENVAIYSTGTVTADSIESGTGPSQVAFNSAWTKDHGKLSLYTKDGAQSSTLQYEIKQFEEAMNSGSVVPIHYFDGALMAAAGTAHGIGGLTMIHDAIMPPIDQLFDVAREYNENLYNMTLGDSPYKIITELRTSFERVMQEVAKQNVDLTGNVNTLVHRFADPVDVPKKAENIKLDELVTIALNEIIELETAVDIAREGLQKEIATYGVNVSNLVTGDNEGSYVTGGKTKAETKAEDDIIQEDSKEKIFKDLAEILNTTPVGKAAMKDIETLMKGCK